MPMSANFLSSKMRKLCFLATACSWAAMLASHLQGGGGGVAGGARGRKGAPQQGHDTRIKETDTCSVSVSMVPSRQLLVAATTT